ncbi:MAG TPA: hypothetical protein VH475_06420 [Tepidisphaeraceae bacterium]
MVAVNRRGEDILPLLEHAQQTFSTQTVWGNLDAVIENSLDAAETKELADSA